MGNEVDLISRRAQGQVPHENLDGMSIYRYKRIPFGGLSSYDKTSGSRRDKIGSGRGVSRLINGMYSIYLRTFHVLYIIAAIVFLSRGKNWDAIIERETAWGAGAIAASILNIDYYLELVGPLAAAICLRKARRILANTRGVVTDDMSPDRIAVLSAGVNTDLYRSRGTQIDNREKLVVGYFGGFLDFHGIESILGSIRPVAESIPEVRFLFVGPYFSNIKSRAEKLELNPWTEFTGAVPYEEVPVLIKRCDLVLAPYDPSKSPLTRDRGLFGSPLKIFEYMACGKPIVATNVGTIPEIFNHSRCGELVNPGSPEELSQAIIRLLSNPPRRKRMGKRGSIVVNDYSWKSIASKILKAIMIDKSRVHPTEETEGT